MSKHKSTYKKKHLADGTPRPWLIRRINARAEQRVHVMGLACAFHAREQMMDTRHRISEVMLSIHDNRVSA